MAVWAYFTQIKAPVKLWYYIDTGSESPLDKKREVQKMEYETMDPLEVLIMKEEQAAEVLKWQY